jgi:septal ring factor EnvC (AmiA/AmiB activator)
MKDQLNRLENNITEIKTMISDDRRRIDALENRKRQRKVS